MYNQRLNPKRYNAGKKFSRGLPQKNPLKELREKFLVQKSVITPDKEFFYLMEKIKDFYSRIDNRVRKLSRTQYAVFTGLFATTGSLLGGLALGNPELIQSLGIGLTLGTLFYISNSDKEKKSS